MSDLETKRAIETALKNFESGGLADRTRDLFGALGYVSEKRLKGRSTSPRAFEEQWGKADRWTRKNALVDEWQSVEMVFQLTDAEIESAATGQQSFESLNTAVDGKIIQSYLLFAVGLKGEAYTRTQLAAITREVNRLFDMPVLILFRHGPTLTLSIIDRRLSKKDTAKDVLEKVTLIKDIRVTNPLRAHIEILFDLSLPQLIEQHGCTNFVELHAAWQKALDTSELNKRFFKEIANWYFWALTKVKFPKGAGADRDVRNALSLIRLITRLIFAWFIKEKKLVPDDVFIKRKVDELLNYDDPNGSTFYKAVLQNLFFATLNQEMNTKARPGNRRFRAKAKKTGSLDQGYMIHTLYRYAGYFKQPQAAIELFANIPFLNGGLFECLDRSEQGRDIRIDGFSDRPDNELVVPDELFFGLEREIDLNEVYGTSNQRHKVRGLILTFEHYKFTVDENTPIEEEIALDPELLGKVFENLLAAYNPETGVTARKQLGAFYTPREIVNYMVDESLAVYFMSKLGPRDSEVPVDLESRLRHLLSYTTQPHQFNAQEIEQLIDAIDTLKAIDPACGSGAFPMGLLHKLVFILGKLDPKNVRWKERQIAKADAIDDAEVRERTVADIEETFERNELDYGRKLYLIENCIFGVDIQPIAVQIAKLRCFISLIVDQCVDEAQPNRGIRPLPNLETKFVAANTLVGIERPLQLGFRNPAIDEKEKDLAEVRHRYMTARTPQTKNKYRDQDSKLRIELSQLLKEDGWSGGIAKQLAQWNPYDQNTAADFFDPEWMFGLTGGFHVVVGNPPYVRQEQIGDLKPLLQQQYQCYTGTADLYVYFYERGLRLLALDGVLTYISSNKYFRSGYGAKLRGFLSNQATVHQLIDFGDAPVFTAIAYPCIIVLSKSVPSGNQIRTMTWQPGPVVEEFVAIFNTNSFLMPQKELTADGWRLETGAVLRLLDKLRQAGKPLGEYVDGKFYYGIKTGLNEAFVVDHATRDLLISEHKSSAEILKPYLRGRDVKRWHVSYQDLWLIFTRRGVDIKKYPAIQSYLRQFKDQLIPGVPGGRKPGSYEWYEIQDNIAYWQQFEQKKIIIPAIAQATAYSLDFDGYYTNDKTSICVTESANYLLGLLNSRLLWWIIRQTAATKQGGFFEFKPMYVSQIPIAASANQKPIETLVDKILAKTKADPETDVSGLERQIDELVYRLYGLTAEEIKIVEGDKG